MADSLKAKAKKYGAQDLEASSRKNKKYVVTLKDGKKINFGDSRYQDYTMHHDKERRKNYRRRAAGITDKQGNLTYKDKKSANFWSYHLLW